MSGSIADKVVRRAFAQRCHLESLHQCRIRGSLYPVHRIPERLAHSVTLRCSECPLRLQGNLHTSAAG